MLHNWINPNKNYAYSGVSAVYDSLKNTKKLKDIENDLSEIRTYTLHKEKKPVKNFNPFFIYSKHQMWQSDLVYLPNFINENEGSKYLMCVLEVFSRKLFIKVIKNKDTKTVLDAFSEIHKSIGASPKILYVDKGGEYVNKKFKDYCTSNSIKLVFTLNDTKAPHVERAQRSIQSLLYKMLEEKQTRHFLPYLDDVLKIYNNRKNRITGFSPNDAYKDENSVKVRENLEKYYMQKVHLRKKPKFKVGDTVRISLKRRVFERGYEPKFSEEVFKIRKIYTNLPQPRYSVTSFDEREKIEGTFYERELAKAAHQDYKIEKILKTRKRGRLVEHLVKWVGYSNEHNSWIKDSDITQKF